MRAAALAGTAPPGCVGPPPGGAPRGQRGRGGGRVASGSRPSAARPPSTARTTPLTKPASRTIAACSPSPAVDLWPRRPRPLAGRLRITGVAGDQHGPVVLSAELTDDVQYDYLAVAGQALGDGPTDAPRAPRDDERRSSRHGKRDLLLALQLWTTSAPPARRRPLTPPGTGSARVGSAVLHGTSVERRYTPA